MFPCSTAGSRPIYRRSSEIPSTSSCSIPPDLSAFPPDPFARVNFQVKSRRRRVLDVYAVLGAERSATWNELRRSYRARCELHPDVQAHRPSPARLDQPRATALFTQLQEAWSMVDTPERRAAYDLSLRDGRSKLRHAEFVPPRPQVGAQGRELEFFSAPGLATSISPFRAGLGTFPWPSFSTERTRPGTPRC